VVHAPTCGPPRVSRLARPSLSLCHRRLGPTRQVPFRLRLQQTPSSSHAARHWPRDFVGRSICSLQLPRQQTPWFPLLLCFGSDSARAYKSLATVSSLPRRERERKQLAAAARHCRGVPPRRTPHRATRACFGVRGVSPDATEASHRIASREGPLDLGNFSTATATPPPIRCSPRTGLQRMPSPVSTCPPCSRNLPFTMHQFNWGLGRFIAGRAAPAGTRSRSERRRGWP
jgi:hypothetical protein